MFDFLFKNKRSLASTDNTQQDVIAINETEEVIFRLKAESAPDMKEIDDRFIGMLLGNSTLNDNELNPLEKKALDQIRHWTELEELPDNIVPRLPSIIPKIMSAIQNENSSAQDIADIISQDVSLVGEVIRLSNSAFYSTSCKVESLKQAIQKMGQNGIRQLISSAAFKPIMTANQGKMSALLSHILWEKNQKAAMAGNLTALTTGNDRFHAYLAGLFSQCGLLVIAKQLEQSFNQSNIPQSRQFMHELDTLSKMITAQIGRQWEMPEEIILALHEQLNEEAPNGISSLGQVGYVADRLAKISLLEEKNNLVGMEEGIQCRVGQIKSATCKQCYSFINLDQRPAC